MIQKLVFLCICKKNICIFPKRYKNGTEVPEEEDNQAEVFSTGVQHLPVPVSVPLHHQHVWHRLRDRRVLRVCTGVRRGGRPLRYNSSTGADSQITIVIQMITDPQSEESWLKTVKSPE